VPENKRIESKHHLYGTRAGGIVEFRGMFEDRVGASHVGIVTPVA